MKKICWFDIESTGKNPGTDRIIQLSLIRTIGIYKEIDRKKLLFNNCGMPIHPEAVKAHGITEDVIAGCRPFSDYAHVILRHIEECDIMGGFNSKNFDTPMLAEEFARCGIDWRPKAEIDCSVIFKRKEARTLSAALKFYTGEKLDGAHDAENDVMATIKVAQGQVFMYDFENEVPIEDILISESCYENEPQKLDFHNKIVNDGRIPIWGFGKNKGKPVKQDLSYCEWVLALNDFPETTKNLIRKIIA